MKRAKIVCNACAVPYLDEASGVTFAFENVPCPPDEEPLLVCVHWHERVLPGALMYRCDDCGTMVAVARSSLWLLGDVAGPS